MPGIPRGVPSALGNIENPQAKIRILKQKVQQNNKTEMNTEQPALDPKWQAAIEGGDRR